MEKGYDIPKMEGLDCLLVHPDGRVLSFGGIRWIRERHEFVALGSGGGFARAAMMAGADAKQAIRIACKLDTHSGGRVMFVELKRSEASLALKKEKDARDSRIVGDGDDPIPDSGVGMEGQHTCLSTQ